MSCGVESLPIGIDDLNNSSFSGLSSPINNGSIPVRPATGLIAQTLIFSGASSIAKDRVIEMTAPFELLYQTNPGRGLTPAVEAILRITPDRCFLKMGMTALQER